MGVGEGGKEVSVREKARLTKGTAESSHCLPKAQTSLNLYIIFLVASDERDLIFFLEKGERYVKRRSIRFIPYICDARLTVSKLRESEVVLFK